MQELQQTNHIPGLDSLRGIAVLSVLCSHYFTLSGVFSWGWIGVDLFFVISGFLITSILLRSKNNTHYFKNFYIRRSLRIIPLSFVVLSVFFLTIAFFDIQNRFGFYKENWWFYFLFVQNWLFVLKGLPNEYYLNHFWSLAVEEQFYLLFPIVVYSFSRKKLVKIIFKSIIIILLIRILVWYFNQDYLPAYYCNTLTRMDSLLFGCLLGCGIRVKKRGFAILSILFSFFVLLIGVIYYRSASLTNPVMATVGYTLIAVINYFFVSHFIADCRNLLFLRRNIPLNYIGKTSFGIYLLHIPVYLVCTAVYYKIFNKPSELAIGCISIFITLFLSTISYYTLERYFLGLKSKFPMHLSTTKQRMSLQTGVAENHLS